MSDISFESNKGSYVCTIDPTQFVMLLIQTAGCVLSETGTMPRDPNEYPTKGAGWWIGQNVYWAPHGYTNALQSQANFLYEAIPVICDNPGMRAMLGPGGAKIIMAALESYQSYKYALIMVQQRKLGAGFGSATGFNQKDWTDRNQSFREFMGLALPSK